MAYKSRTSLMSQIELSLLYNLEIRCSTMPHSLPSVVTAVTSPEDTDPTLFVTTSRTMYRVAGCIPVATTALSVVGPVTCRATTDRSALCNTSTVND